MTAIRPRDDQARPTADGCSIAAALALAALLLAAPALALETDQYLTWRHPLRDSSTVVNAFVNARFEAALDEVNRRDPERLSCEQLPSRLYRSLFHRTTRRVLCPWCSSPIRSFLENAPGVDRFPPPGMSQGAYKKQSIFRHPAFPFVLPLASSVRIGDVYLGTDKPPHMFGFGGRYYRRYLRARRQGAGEGEAMRQAIHWGLALERFLVGGLTDGIVSYADLEANYQGLRLARDLCEAEPPHLELTQGGWRLVRPVDLRPYISPQLDESYNNSHYSDHRWKRIRGILEEEICPLYRSAEIQARRARYARLERPNLSRQMIADRFPAGVDRQRRQSADTVCARPAAMAPAAAPP